MDQLTRSDTLYISRRLPRDVLVAMKELHGKLMVAGGVIRACIANERVNDIDLFVDCEETANAAVKLIRRRGKPYVTDNAITLRRRRGPVVQIITRWTFKTPSDLVESFDFTICAAAMWYDKHGACESITDHRFYSDLAAKRLTYTSPVRKEAAGGSMLRVLKYYQRGYRIPLDSLARVTSRLVCAVEFERLNRDAFEGELAHVIRGLLIEVDPNGAGEHAFFNEDKDDDDVQV